MSEVTHIRDSLQHGGSGGADALLIAVYAELRGLAAAKLARETPGQTLQPTALVHECWLRLTNGQKIEFQGRQHFFAAAAEAMRRILIDNARRKRAVRHGGGLKPLDIADLQVAARAEDEHVLAVHEALDRLAAHDSTKAELVKLRYFAGLTLLQAADVLGISEATAKRHWAYARAWLYREIRGENENISS